MTRSYGLHVFTVPVKVEAGWEQHEAALINALHEVCAPYLEQAKEAMSALSRDGGLDAPSVEPRVQLAVPEPGRVDLIARLPYPVDQKNRVIQRVLRAYLQAAVVQSETGPEEPNQPQD